MVAALLVATLCGLAAAWLWGGAREWAELDRLIGRAEALDAHPATAPLVVAGIALGSMLGIPLSALVVATVLVFGSVAGFCYGLAGAELSAVATYGVGRWVGRELVRRYAGEWVNAVSERLAKRGLLTVIALRMVPVAPYPVINLVAGASHIGLAAFAWGTVLGLLPGTLAIALFAEAAARTLRSADGGGSGWLIAGVVAVAAVILWLRRRRVSRRGPDQPPATASNPGREPNR